MRTEDLIAALAQDPAATPLRSGRIGAAVIGIIALCVGVFLTVIGLRADLAAVLTTPLLASKTLLPAVLSLAALPVVVRLMRPEKTGPVLGRAVLWTALAVAALLYAVGFATQSRAQWFADVSPASVLQCLGFILLISLPALGLCFALVRQGATTAPAQPPRAWTKRAAIKVSILGASAQTAEATKKTAIPISSGGRRPSRSEAGP